MRLAALPLRNTRTRWPPDWWRSLMAVFSQDKVSRSAAYQVKAGRVFRSCLAPQIAACALLLAGPVFHFDISDARGRKPPGVTLEASAPDESGWVQLKAAAKSKGNPVLVWPFDGRAARPDGPGDILAIVVEWGDAKALANTRVVAALAAGELLGVSHDIGLDAAALAKAVEGLGSVDEPFARGVGLLAAKKPAEAFEPLARALRERERQLTRVPSEIYPAAMLCGRALLGAGKFDDAAVAFLKALKQRPADPEARRLRREALEKAGKPEAQ